MPAKRSRKPKAEVEPSPPSEVDVSELQFGSEDDTEEEGSAGYDSDSSEPREDADIQDAMMEYASALDRHGEDGEAGDSASGR